MNGIIVFDSISGSLLLYRKFRPNFGLPPLKQEYGSNQSNGTSGKPPKAEGSASSNAKSDSEIAGDLALEFFALQRFGVSGSNTGVHSRQTHSDNKEFLMWCDICPPQSQINFEGVRAFCAHDACPQAVTAVALVNPCLIPANVAYDLAGCVFSLIKTRPTASTPRGTVSERQEFSDSVFDVLCNDLLFDWSNPHADAVFKLNATLLPKVQQVAESPNVQVIALPPKPNESQSQPTQPG